MQGRWTSACGWLLLMMLGAQDLFSSPGKGKEKVLAAMQAELSRSMEQLRNSRETPPYFISYSIDEVRDISIHTSYGALLFSSDRTLRTLYVSVRVGDPKLDNTHPLRDEATFRTSIPVPISVEDDPDAIRSVLWLETDKKYKEAVQRLAKVRSDQAVKTAEENPSDDFSRESPLVQTVESPPLSLNVKEWENRLRSLSSQVKAYPFILESSYYLRAQRVARYFVSSEGSRVRTSQCYVRLGVDLDSRAEDGMDLRQFDYWSTSQVGRLPGDAVVQARVRELAETLRRLREAPLVEPYAGPAILSGKSAGVFFHEIFGHRVEGHRQKDESQGQTFAKRVGEKILPDFLSVVDDPTLATLDGNDLNGFYVVDDEGIRAQRVVVVEKGILKNFLMSRSPFREFIKSNGHGRAMAGYDPLSRQGNLLVQASATISPAKLREMLIAECKKQGKPFGLIFQEVEGGFTQTGRYSPNTFNVRPVLVYRVFIDGRPDEIVRGVDLIGTPLTPFSKILAAANDYGIFNGYCGAESGSVPVSAISPSLLVGEIEVQKKEKTTEKPPILPPPIDAR